MVELPLFCTTTLVEYLSNVVFETEPGHEGVSVTPLDPPKATRLPQTSILV